MVLSPALAESLLFQPSRGDPGSPPHLAGVDGASLHLTTSDGVQLLAWWYDLTGRGERRSPGPSDTLEYRPPAVLLLHGNAGDISHRTPLAQGLLEEGFSVLLLEYRGYGGSGGKPSEVGLTRDAIAGLEFLEEEVGGRHRVIVFGRSLGGAVAVSLLASRRAGALILESSFTSLEAMARRLYWFVPPVFFRRLRGRFDTLGMLPQVEAPTMVIHGREDEIVPFEMGEELRGARGPECHWYPVERAGHNDVFWVGGRDYFTRIGDFIRENVEGGL